MIVWTLAAITPVGVTTSTHTSLRDAMHRFAADFDPDRDSAGVLTGTRIEASERV